MIIVSKGACLVRAFGLELGNTVAFRRPNEMSKSFFFDVKIWALVVSFYFTLSVVYIN